MYDFQRSQTTKEEKEITWLLDPLPGLWSFDLISALFKVRNTKSILLRVLFFHASEFSSRVRTFASQPLPFSFIQSKCTSLFVWNAKRAITASCQSRVFVSCKHIVNATTSRRWLLFCLVCWRWWYKRGWRDFVRFAFLISLYIAAAQALLTSVGVRCAASRFCSWYVFDSTLSFILFSSCTSSYHTSGLQPFTHIAIIVLTRHVPNHQQSFRIFS